MLLINLEDLVRSGQQSFFHYDTETLKSCFGDLYFTVCANELPINNIEILYDKYTKLDSKLKMDNTVILLLIFS